MSFQWLVFCLFFLCLSSRPLERIAWQDDRPLKWSDFKGTPDYLMDFVATTNSGMSHSYIIDGNGLLIKSSSTVYAHFYPTFSWYKQADTTATILRHEQNHFDITELYARKLRKRIQEYHFTSNSKNEVKALYELTEQERRKAQHLYDLESDHSRNKEQDVYWIEKIQDSLEIYLVYMR